jgi:AraC-like DNA-binding protein
MPSLSNLPRSAVTEFTEAPAWRGVGNGWRPLHGGFREMGFSIEWHDFETADDLDWATSFHPCGVEICLNLSGRGEVRAAGRCLELHPCSAGFYLQGQSRLSGVRRGGERHQFITVEFSGEFIARHVAPKEAGLHPCLKSMFRQVPEAAVSEASPLTSEQRELIHDLQSAPPGDAGRRMWSLGKALELASALFYPPAADGEFFCQRQKRLNHERVQKVIAILKENLAAPPSLEVIGRRVGCSQFHLSRIFSEQMGCGIFQHLRVLRMERAEALLRESDLTITQIALEVGYSSPSHFTTTFRNTYACCPGLYLARSKSPRIDE